MAKYYKISDFAQQIGKHQNTVDGWFKKMEEAHVHYVNRVENEKIYDEQDLEIALFIREKREEGWALRAIFNELEEQFELRPFPEGTENNETSLDLEVVRRKFSEDMKVAIDEAVKAQVEVAISEVKRQYEEIIKQLPTPADLVKQLPPPVDPMEARQERITDMITVERLRSQLRKEALHLWSTKPEDERTKRTGLFGFKKEEDHGKRDLFVNDYISEHISERLESLKEDLKKGQA